LYEVHLTGPNVPAVHAACITVLWYVGIRRHSAEVCVIDVETCL